MSRNLTENRTAQRFLTFDDRQEQCSRGLNARSFLEHPKVLNDPHTLVWNKTQGLFDVRKQRDRTESQEEY